MIHLSHEWSWFKKKKKRVLSVVPTITVLFSQSWVNMFSVPQLDQFSMQLFWKHPGTGLCFLLFVLRILSFFSFLSVLLEQHSHESLRKRKMMLLIQGRFHFPKQKPFWPSNEFNTHFGGYMLFHATPGLSWELLHSAVFIVTLLSRRR